MFKKIYEKIDNFWYHNKWQIVFIAFFTLVAAVAAGQMITKTNDDVIILYAGPHQFTPNETREIQTALKSVMSADFNGDGEKHVQVISILLMTQEQLEKARKNAAESGNVVLYNSAALIQNRSQFSTQIFAGETVICLLDPNWYPDIYENGGFIKLSDALGYTPDKAIDEYSIYLHDTGAAGYFTALQYFPADTVLCVRRMSTATAFKSEKKESIRYENQLRMFRDIMSFSP